MEFRKLGRSGMVVSSFGLGSWLTDAGSVREESARDGIWRARHDSVADAELIVDDALLGVMGETVQPVAGR